MHGKADICFIARRFLMHGTQAVFLELQPDVFARWFLIRGAA